MRKGGSRQVRVAFFPMHPPDDRASGIFCVLPATRASDRGIEGKVFAPSSTALHESFYRRKSAGWRIRAAIYWYGIVLPRRLWQLFRARNYDVIFVQRSMFRWTSPPAMEWLARRITGLPLVYHLDDGIWLAARRRWSEARCRLATTVVTGNEAIAEFAEGAGATVTDIEYAVDASAYPVKRHSDRTPAIIGYTAFYPEEHLAPIAAALGKTCEATGARIKVVGGMRRPSIAELEPHLDWQPWNPDDEYFWATDFDIGIMPLIDNELHRAKEPVKIKDYMAAGLPIVLSPVGHNRRVVTDGREGFFASSPEEWSERLERLIGDPSLRGAMGVNGRELVLERYDLPRLLDQLADLFHRLADGRKLSTEAA